MQRPTNYKFRLAYFLLFVVVFIIGIPILVFYSAGYTIDETFNLSIRGGIYVYTPEPDTSVFIGNELKNTSGFFNKEILVGGLKPDQYTVLATNEDFWPWAKIVTVRRGEVEALFPFLVPKVVDAEEILANTSDYREILEVFAEKRELLASAVSKTPAKMNGAVATGTTATHETITRRQVEVWLDNDTLFARYLGRDDAAPNYYCYTVTTDPKNILGELREEEECSDPIRVFESSVPIRTFDFYPYRDDAIIVALDNGIYAIETDFRSYQNFYPLFRGENPDFRVYKNQVYVKDGAYVAVLDLDN